ncbi:MAG: VCBS repeat-containing protein [Sedimentisphaerales bacterium]|nr:VCBS repeat-containing protein [Sedimentisphaerales bacterium]
MSRIRISSVLLLTLASVLDATAVEFKQQTIVVPSDQKWWLSSHLADVDGDGLADLLALLPAQNELMIYRQRADGFAATPDQTVTLPGQTAWIAMQDVDPHEGKELVISTAAGLVYLRQSGGVFESSSRAIIEARQVFAGDRPGIAATTPGRQDANDVLPVFFEDRAVLYEKDERYAWHAARTVDLRPTQTTWQVGEESWMTGPTPAFSMEVRKTVRRRPQEEVAKDRKAGEELIEKIAKDAQWRHHSSLRQDVNGDGRDDIVLWRTHGDISPETTIVLLLREPDGSLPARPTRVLRHSGLPIRVDRKLGVSPFWDLDGDGRCELILLTLKTRVTSWSGLFSLFVSGGVEWVFTVRSGRDGAYSGTPSFRMDITSMTPHSEWASGLISIDGDFNRDGREDILVKRGPERFDVYLSSADTGFFQAGPAFSLQAPVEARVIGTADLNGDGISDLFVQKALEPLITVCVSQADHQKGTPK